MGGGTLSNDDDPAHSVRSGETSVTTPLLSLLIPGPVLGKGRARSTKAGHHYTPAATRANEASLSWYMAQAWGGKPLLDEALRLELVIHFEVPASWSKKRRALALAGEIIPTGKPDLDNVVKSIADSGNGIVWRDDALIAQLVVHRWYAEAPSLLVRVCRPLSRHDP